MRVWEAADDRGAETKAVDGHANNDGAKSLLEREVLERAWRKGIRLSFVCIWLLQQLLKLVTVRKQNNGDGPD